MIMLWEPIFNESKEEEGDYWDIDFCRIKNFRS